ncbi:MAG TPA: tetratricopeptide repeat protein [bacterium]|nr:tetratricopeptide repeat protein [bacterium]
MKRLLLLAVMVTLAGAATTDRAEYMFFNRQLNPTWLDSAFNLLAAAHTASPSDEHLLYLWSRANVKKGEYADTKADKLMYFGRAKAIAETLIALNDENDEGHCWWGVAQGRIGQTRGVLNSLFMVPGLKKAFNRALEINPNHPTALDAYGVLYYELPGFAGGSLDKAEEYYTRGIAVASNYTLLRLDLARTYVKEKRWVAARAQLDSLLATTDPKYAGDAELDDKPDARRLLKQIEGR